MPNPQNTVSAPRPNGFNSLLPRLPPAFKIIPGGQAVQRAGSKASGLTPPTAHRQSCSVFLGITLPWSSLLFRVTLIVSLCCDHSQGKGPVFPHGGPSPRLLSHPGTCPFSWPENDQDARASTEPGRVSYAGRWHGDGGGLSPPFCRTFQKSSTTPHLALSVGASRHWSLVVTEASLPLMLS